MGEGLRTSMDPLYIVTGYTPGGLYEQAAMDLVRSIARFAGPVVEDVEAIRLEETGSWTANCAQKAAVVRDALIELGGKDGREDCVLLWIDADAEVLGPLDELAMIEAEFAIRYREGRITASYGPFMSGTVMMRPTRRSKNLARLWANEAYMRPSELDQILLHEAWEGMEARPSTAYLPDRYCVKFDERLPEGEVPMIVHSMASRKSRRYLRP